jgi:hypothetical protein
MAAELQSLFNRMISFRQKVIRPLTNKLINCNMYELINLSSIIFLIRSQCFKVPVPINEVQVQFNSFTKGGIRGFPLRSAVLLPSYIKYIKSNILSYIFINNVKKFKNMKITFNGQNS